MKALVGIKRVLDYAIKARVRADKLGIEKQNVKMSINPFCEIAVEEAIRMREKGWIKHVTTISIGDKTAAETLRHSLALGADDSIHVLTNDPIDTHIQPLAVAKILKYFAQDYNMILLGKQVFYNKTGYR
jgi:electron transfer flavoprotein beta subunit